MQLQLFTHVYSFIHKFLWPVTDITMDGVVESFLLIHSSVGSNLVQGFVVRDFRMVLEGS